VPAAPQNGSTIELPALASELGLTSGSNKLNYQVATFPIVRRSLETSPRSARTACSSRRSRRVILHAQPGSVADAEPADRQGKFAGTTVRGGLVVTLDDANGAAQAEEISAFPLP
jgi:hypothetical protein